MADRAVSEVLGFILVFSLIAVAVGTVYVVGFTGLQDARDAEQLTNTERAFDVLADNMEDIVRRDAPNRATEFRLYQADFTVGERTKFTVEITNDGSSDTIASVSAYPLVYSSSGSPTTIRYVNGAVIRQDRGGAVVLDDPTFVFRETGSERTAVIPLVSTRGSGTQAVGGTGTVLVRAERAIAESLIAETNPATGDNLDGDASDEYNVEMRIETSETRAPVWSEYLNEELDDAYGVTPCSLPSPDTVECTFHVERLYVTATRIDVSLGS